MTKCTKCETVTDIKDMDIKMGGLLCPNCRRILFQPYVDKEYFEEYRRRQRQEIAESFAIKPEDLKGGQKGS